MRRRKLRTANYPESARVRLGDAVAKAREAAGYKWRTTFAREAGIQSVRSLELLERGDPGVGESILFAVGRVLPNWDEDTPRIILEGGPVPSNTQGPKPLAEMDRAEAIDRANDIARNEGEDAGTSFMLRWADAVKASRERETSRDAP